MTPAENRQQPLADFDLQVRDASQPPRPLADSLDLEADLLDVRPRDDAPMLAAPEAPPVVVDRADEVPAQPAGAFRRFEAACVDVLFIGAINLAVVWLTLQRCDLTFAEASQLPMLP